MNLLQVLRESRKSSGSALIEFRQKYRKGEQVVYLFYEGEEDESLYINFIESKLKAGWHFVPFRCYGKSNVYDAYSRIEWGAFYARSRVLFFVDKDLSDFLGEANPVDSNIFVTEHYSVENYLTTERMVERVIRELYGLPDEGAIQLLIAQFSLTQQKFWSKCLSLMSWVLIMRINRETLELNSIDIAKLFSVDYNLNATRVSNFFYHIRKATSVSRQWSRSELREARRVLKKSANPKSYIRGKFDLQFFVLFANAMAPAINAALKSGGRPAMKVKLTQDNAIEILGPRLKIPTRLNTFLDSHL